MIYAQINEENICTVISDMGEVETSQSDLIPIASFDTSLLGRRYNNGEWEETETIEPEKGDTDARPAELLTTIRQEAIDEYTLKLIEEGVL